MGRGGGLQVSHQSGSDVSVEEWSDVSVEMMHSSWNI